MTNLPQSFNKLLELYVLTTANQVINLATPEQQTQLIKLIIDIPTEIPSVAIQQAPVINLQEKQPLPDQPLTNRLIHDLWLTEVLKRQIERNEVCIARIEQAIETTEQGFQSRTNGFLSATAQANLDVWHTNVLKQYQDYLVTLQTIQRNSFYRLNRLTESYRPSSHS